MVSQPRYQPWRSPPWRRPRGLLLAVRLCCAAAALQTVEKACKTWLGPQGLHALTVSSKSAPWTGAPRVPQAVRSQRPPRLAAPADKSSAAASDDTLAASLNLAKNLVGSGILSLPAGVAAFSATAGALGPAACLLILAAFFSAYGYFLIGRVCEATGATTFAGAWRESVGRGAWVPQLTCILECLGGSIIYAMVLGDMFSSLAQGLPLLPAIVCNRTFMIAVLGILVLFPLCCLRTFAQLAKFSALGTAAASYVVVFVVKRFLDGSYSRGGQFYLPAHARALDTGAGMGVDARILILASILSTAFLVHFNAPQMYTELQPAGPLESESEKSRKQSKFAKVAAFGFGLATLQYACVMAFGFLTFGRFADGNLLLNYATSDMWAVAARVAIGLSVLFGYPMQFAGLRSGLLESFGQRQPLGRLQHRLLTAGLLLVVVVAACRFRDLGKFQALEGAVLAAFLTYIAPPAMALQIWKRPAARLRYVSLLLLGVLVSAVGCVVTLSAP